MASKHNTGVNLTSFHGDHTDVFGSAGVSDRDMIEGRVD